LTGGHYSYAATGCPVPAGGSDKSDAAYL